MLPTGIYIAVGMVVVLKVVEIISAFPASSKLAKLPRRRGVWATYESGAGPADRRCRAALKLAGRGYAL